MPSILGIIPARFASTRLHGKPLLKIGEETMIERVYNQVKKCSLIEEVIVATDDKIIFKHVKEFGGNAIMTSQSHQSGTDRCYEAYINFNKNYDYIINIQGDEPFIKPEQIALLAKLLRDDTEIATLVKKIDDYSVLFNENSPKVVISKNMEALYFSRQTIPLIRDQQPDNWLKNNDFYKHLGIYGYRADILEKITKLPPSALELAEKLEQLRWLENGYKIKVSISPYDSIGIDTAEDLEKAIKLI